jgi:hypothetical protein
MRTNRHVRLTEGRHAAGSLGRHYAPDVVMGPHKRSLLCGPRAGAGLAATPGEDHRPLCRRRKCRCACAPHRPVAERCLWEAVYCREPRRRQWHDSRRSRRALAGRRLHHVMGRLAADRDPACDDQGALRLDQGFRSRQRGRDEPFRPGREQGHPGQQRRGVHRLGERAAEQAQLCRRRRRQRDASCNGDLPQAGPASK